MRLSRRRFVAASTLALASANLRAAGANDVVRLAIIGCGGKGGDHIEQFRKIQGVRIAALCDVDPARLADRAKKLDGPVDKVADLRRIFDRTDIDAVVIATPNHWHALAAIWAMQSGKDAYVEKPVSHNVWEGKQLVAAAAKYKRIVQAGTQFRSDEALAEAVAYVRSGQLGKIQWAHVPWFEQRGSIGKAAPHRPTDVDYDLYCGPAPLDDLTRPRLHYDWHWFWSTGDGDLGNSGIHAFDVARWFLGYETLPERVLCIGGRFGVDDAAETPNTQLTILGYPVPVVIENRNLPGSKGGTQRDHVRSVREGVIIQCEHGYFAGLRQGGHAYDNDHRKLKQFVGDGGAKHQQNFIDAVRARNDKLLKAPIAGGHLSSAVCHLGNLSYRLGRTFDQPPAKLERGQLMDERLGSILEHLVANEVDPKRTPLTMGAALVVDARTEEVASAEILSVRDATDDARKLWRGTHRPGFGIKDV
jgi:predicted dehydrogenase